MKWFRHMIMLSVICLSATAVAEAQTIAPFSFVTDSVHSYTVKFKEINNLILVPLSFNDIDTLYFIMDSGAENITLFGSEFSEPPVDTMNLRQVKVAGGGSELLTAFVSPFNSIRIGPITGEDLNTIFIPGDFVSFSDLLGHPVHGIIGVPIFHSFVIKLDYFKKTITFYDRDHIKIKRRYSKLPLTIRNGRPYLDIDVEIHPRITMSTSLLVDLGESKPMSLFLSTNEAFILPYPNYYANLGKGLSGMVTGRVASVNSVTIDRYVLRNVITAFPDQEAIQFLTNAPDRNGSLGAGILKRFVTIFDLANEAIYLKRTGLMRHPFSYDKTGLIIVAEGERFDQFRISGVIRESAAERAGLRKDDLIHAIRGEPVQGKSLGIVLKMIEDSGRKIFIDVERDGEILEYRIRVFKVL
jgi:hypothetical protein